MATQTLPAPDLPRVHAIKDNAHPVQQNPSGTQHFVAPPVQRNPYLLLNSTLLQEIARERDVELGRGPFMQKAQILHELDSIMPDWITHIAQTTPITLLTLSTVQLYTYAAINGVQLGTIFNDIPSRTYLADLIASIILCPVIAATPTPRDYRHVLNVVKTISGVISMTGRGYVPTLPPAERPLHNTTPEDLRQIMIEMCQYPLNVDVPTYIFIRGLNHKAVCRGLEYRGLPKGIASFLNKEEAIFAISRGYLLPMGDRIEQYQQRYQILQMLEPFRKNLMLDLYDTYGADALIDIAKVDSIHPLENAILAIGRAPVAAIADSVGMVIPPGVNAATYLSDNILHYKKVVARVDPIQPLNRGRFMETREGVISMLEEYTDMELMSSLGIYIAYSGRLPLLRRICSLRSSEGFFISMITQFQKRRLCRNNRTMMLTDIQDPDALIISFGTYRDHIGYEPDELTNAFHFKSENGTADFVFLRPDDVRQMFTNNQVEELQSLLIKYPECVALVEKIRAGLQERKSKTDYDRNILRRLVSVSPDQMENFRQYLYRLFFAGMYMRRWEGPGRPYPLTTHATQKKISPDESTIQALEAAQVVLNTIEPTLQKIIRELRMIQYYGDIPEQTGDYVIGAYFESVVMGKECIRMASSRFVATSYYYLKTYLKEVIPNLDIAILDRIQ